MRKFMVHGKTSLKGEVVVSGAKNAALPILASTILLSGESVIRNVPRLNDVITIIRVLRALGIRAEYSESEPNTVRVATPEKIKHVTPYELVTKMRASFFVLGPILGRNGLAKVSLPGGCAIGARPVNLHLNGLKKMGAEIKIEHGFVIAIAKKLSGAKICLDLPSVGATENLIMAAVLAEGETVIENAAQEPEVIDLANCLNQAGAKISGMGTDTIKVKGVSKLSAVEYEVMPDRIEAGTYLMAGAMTQGDVTVNKINPHYLTALLDKMEEAGAKIKKGQDSITLKAHKRLKSVDITTKPYPGFPTDLQSQFTTMMSTCEGTSVVSETVFENRFMHVQELMRMGAKIRLTDHTAIIDGVESLSNTPVKVTDLRAGAALIMAGLASEGETVIEDLERHIERGYEDLAAKFKRLGAKIEIL